MDPRGKLKVRRGQTLPEGTREIELLIAGKGRIKNRAEWKGECENSNVANDERQNGPMN